MGRHEEQSSVLNHCFQFLGFQMGWKLPTVSLGREHQAYEVQADLHSLKLHALDSTGNALIVPNKGFICWGYFGRRMK